MTVNSKQFNNNILSTIPTIPINPTNPSLPTLLILQKILFINKKILKKRKVDLFKFRVSWVSCPFFLTFFTTQNKLNFQRWKNHFLRRVKKHNGTSRKA